jgi:predicted transcriptional regulator of viral defense system
MHVESQAPPIDRPQGRDHALAELATRQHGLVTSRQLAALGFGRGAISHRLKLGRLHPIHAGVYALGHKRLTTRGRWLAAVLACGEGAALSHRSAAGLWGLIHPRAAPVDVTSRHGRQGRAGISLHQGQIHDEDLTTVDAIPVTAVARTLFDLAEVVDERRLERAFEEADRLGLLEMQALEQVCARGRGRHALRPIRRLIAMSRLPPTTRSPLEDHFTGFCQKHQLPPPATNVLILGLEVDALWPRQRLIVELDGFAFHRHHAAFERDRARDSALQAAGYRVVRLTHRRLQAEEPRSPTSCAGSCPTAVLWPDQLDLAGAESLVSH